MTKPERPARSDTRMEPPGCGLWLNEEEAYWIAVPLVLVDAAIDAEEANRDRELD